MGGNQVLDKITADEIMNTINRVFSLIDESKDNIETLFERYAHIKDDFDRSKTYIRKNDNRVLKLIIQENKNSEHIRAAQEDINQLYLLFNELIRSNKKDKDDG